jgi:hypothetical protein
LRPSESIAGFLDHAQASRVLFPEQVEQLIRQPDIPQSNLDALCEYLLSRGVLTRFQAAAIREDRGPDLNFAGYPVIDEIGPCPGGTAYKALHPSLRTSLVLRRIRPDWLAPIDGPAPYIARARAFGTIVHPNIIHLFDAGVYHDEVYAVIEHPSDSVSLEELAREIGGAMPAFLAAEFCRPVASALRGVHERGATHGDVRPTNFFVGPLAVKTSPEGRTRRRPAPEAVARLAEVGLVPIRPAIATYQAALTPYLPPERLVAGVYDPRGDIYSLGATLYFLLTGREPFAGDSARDLMNRIHATDPDPLGALRPDLPPEFVALVARMLEKRPDRRPETAAEVEQGLAAFCRPGTVPPSREDVPTAAPASGVLVAYPVGDAPAEIIPAAEVEGGHEEQPDPWGVGSAALAGAHADAEAAPRKRRMSAKDKARTRMLLLLGAILHLSAVALLVLWLTGAFKPSSSPSTAPENKPGLRQDDDEPAKKTRQRGT